MFTKFLIRFIKIYQKLISPNHSFLSDYYPAFLKCRFYPTCSDYFISALKKKGLVKGIFLGSKRIFKCNPFNDGGIDSL